MYVNSEGIDTTVYISLLRGGVGVVYITSYIFFNVKQSGGCITPELLQNMGMYKPLWSHCNHIFFPTDIIIMSY